MRWSFPLLVLAALAFAAPSPARAFSLFSRRPKVDPAQRVPELINTIRTAHEERKRVAAIEELYQYDAAAFPQIVPLLTDLLKNDPSSSVRAEAAHSLGRLRPASPAASEALDAAIHDSALRVRWQARSALLFYPTTAAPPTATAKKGPPPLPAPVVVDSPRTAPANPVLLPVPSPAPTIAPVRAPDIARPLPRGPSATPPSSEPPIAVPDPGTGPELAPPP
jgi:hypothetical protein